MAQDEKMLVSVPDRAAALRVGKAILEAHGAWETENVMHGGQAPWCEQHCILLGQAAMLEALSAAPAQPAPMDEEASGERFAYVPLDRGAYPDELIDDLNGFITGGSGRCRAGLEDMGVVIAARPSPTPAADVVRSQPDDPTEEMIQAALEVDFDNEDERGAVINLWHVMIDAAPPAADDDRVRVAARALLDACVKDFGDPAEFEGDDGAVASGKDGDCAVTFKHMRDLAAALKSTPPANDALRVAVEAWDELAKRPSWEISFSGFDEEDGWSVHSVTGGVNDREWDELARADTPLEAVLAALKAEKK